MPCGTSACWSRASRTMSCADGGSGGRGGRRSTKRSAPRSSRKVKFEPPPSPIRRAATGPLPRPCASRNASSRSRTRSGGRASPSASAAVSAISTTAMLRPTRAGRVRRGVLWGQTNVTESVTFSLHLARSSRRSLVHSAVSSHPVRTRLPGQSSGGPDNCLLDCPSQSRHPRLTSGSQAVGDYRWRQPAAIAATPASATTTPGALGAGQPLAEEDVREQHGDDRIQRAEHRDERRAARARSRTRTARSPRRRRARPPRPRRASARGSRSGAAPHGGSRRRATTSEPTRAPTSVESTSPSRLPRPRK